MRQTVQDFEWLILDDSPAPSAFFMGLDHPRIRYQHYTGPRLTIGEKRNRLVRLAAGGTIVHFDDDDFYAPNYLEFMAARLAKGADAAKFSAFYVYGLFSEFLGYWDVPATRGLHYKLSAASGITITDFGPTDSPQLAAAQWGFGFCYAYRRSLWEKNPFPDQDLGEDRVFVEAARDAGFKLDIFPDTQGLALHIIRHDNISQCWPQYSLPNFLLTQIFGQDVLPMAGR